MKRAYKQLVFVRSQIGEQNKKHQYLLVIDNAICFRHILEETGAFSMLVS